MASELWEYKLPSKDLTDWSDPSDPEDDKGNPVKKVKTSSHHKRRHFPPARRQVLWEDGEGAIVLLSDTDSDIELIVPETDKAQTSHRQYPQYTAHTPTRAPASTAPASAGRAGSPSASATPASDTTSHAPSTISKHSAPLCDAQMMRHNDLLHQLRQGTREVAACEVVAHAPENITPSRTHPMSWQKAAARPAAKMVHKNEPAKVEQSTDLDDGATDDNKLLLKVQCSAGRVSIRIDRRERFSKLFNKFLDYAMGKSWMTSNQQCIFLFDGQKLRPEQTALNLELDDGDVLDVNIV